MPQNYIYLGNLGHPYGKQYCTLGQTICMYYDIGVLISLENKRGSLCIKKEQKMPSGNIELECQMSCGAFEVVILSWLIKRLQ